MSTSAQDKLCEALARAVTDFGIRGISDPTRLRAALVDLLGADARVMRQEIDAVVAAGAADIPEALRAEGSPDVDALIARVTAHDVPPTLAALAVSAWAKALEPFMSATIEVPSVPAPTIVPLVAPTIVPDEAPAGASEMPGTVLPEGVEEPTGDQHRSRRALVVAVAAVVATMAIAGTAWAVSSGGDSKKVAVVNTTTTTRAKTPTTKKATKKKKTTTTTHSVVTTVAPTTVAPIPQPIPEPQPQPQPIIPTPLPEPTPVPAPQPQPVIPIPVPKPVPVPVPVPVPKPVPTPVPAPKPAPQPVPNGQTQPTAVDIYTSIYSCWTGAQWQSHYLGMTSQLPSGWTYVTTPTGQLTNYGHLAYGTGDYWYQPDSRYGGNYNDAFYYAYKNAQGVWSNWGVAHIAIHASGTC